MSETSQVAGLLARLDKSLNRKSKGGKKDWAALNEERKRIFFKPKPGKNQIVILTPDFAEDPFSENGYHQGLQEVSYYAVPCDHFNKDEECSVCQVVNALKKESFDKNKGIWMPIELRKEYYAPIIDVESEATIAEGPKWMRFSKTIMNSIFEWLKNLEDGELPFYTPGALERILITYDKTADPKDQYKMDKKPFKDQPSVEKVAEWTASIKPVSEYIFSKSQEDIKKLVDEYLVRISETMDDSMEPEKKAAPTPTVEEKQTAPTNSMESKLSKLKKG